MMAHSPQADRAREHIWPPGQPSLAHKARLSREERPTGCSDETGADVEVLLVHAANLRGQERERANGRDGGERRCRQSK